MSYSRKHIVRTAFITAIFIFGALWWLSIQRSRIQGFEQQKQYQLDIENAFSPIDEITLSMFNRVSDQEIRTQLGIDEKGKNDYIQFKYSYKSTQDIERQINLVRQYSIVLQKQLDDWRETETVCDFHVCKQYTQYIQELELNKSLYKASKKRIDSTLSASSVQRLNPGAYNL